MCFGGRKTREKWKICLKVRLFSASSAFLRVCPLQGAFTLNSDWSISIWARAQIQRPLALALKDSWRAPREEWLVIFPYNSLYIQAVAYTTYFELREPVLKAKKTLLVFVLVNSTENYLRDNFLCYWSTKRPWKLVNLQVLTRSARKEEKNRQRFYLI